MSHSNSIKKLLNIKEKNFKITKVSDEDIKGIITKVVYAVASKKNAKCPCCTNKLIKNGFKFVSIKILKASQYNTLLKVSKQRYICKN
ncbi:transposase family protein, partial [Fusobacterium russii]|uniref:transposase family protein n=1 Tax=Fusobacterium russii TaxID=854 RepID=UPI0003B69E12